MFLLLRRENLSLIQQNTRILKNIPGDSDDIYLVHETGAIEFSIRHEDGT